MTSLLLEHRRFALPQRTALMVSSIVVFGAIYGAVLGSWHGVRLAVYVAAKVPILLIATAVITSLFNFVAASLLGLSIRYREVLAMTLLPLAVAAMVAASVSPAAWLFTTSLPPPSPAQRTLHNLMYLVHIAIVAGSGYAGTTFLGRSLEEIAGSARIARNVRFTWIAAYAFVAGEIAWILRPFVGSVYLPVEFIRDDALRGNVYEFIVTDILPHLIRQLEGALL